MERVKRKYARGELTIGDDGVATAISKKDIKKLRKAEEKLEAKTEEEELGKKRKRKSEDGSKEKKVKKSKA